MTHSWTEFVEEVFMRKKIMIIILVGTLVLTGCGPQSVDTAGEANIGASTTNEALADDNAECATDAGERYHIYF